jgi:hypothetical protein
MLAHLKYRFDLLRLLVLLRPYLSQFQDFLEHLYLLVPQMDQHRLEVQSSPYIQSSPSIQ